MAALAKEIIMRAMCLIHSVHTATLSALRQCGGQSITHPINLTTAQNIPPVKQELHPQTRLQQLRFGYSWGMVMKSTLVQ